MTPHSQAPADTRGPIQYEVPIPTAAPQAPTLTTVSHHQPIAVAFANYETPLTLQNNLHVAALATEQQSIYLYMSTNDNDHKA